MKNTAELEGMRQAHLKDAVALIQYLVWLEDQVKVKKEVVLEAEGASKLEQFRCEFRLLPVLAVPCCTRSAGAATAHASHTARAARARAVHLLQLHVLQLHVL
jgi:Xaa-Pro aminopeptidase